VASRPARQLLAVWGLRLAVLLGGLTAVAQVVSYHYGLRDHILDSSSDNSVVGALTALLLGATVAIAWLLALTRRRPQLFVLAACLSVVFAVELAHPPHKVAVSTPFGVAAVVVLWRLGATDPLARRLLRVGVVVLAVAFVGHSAGSWLVDRHGLGPDSWLYQLKAIVKHAGELAAWTLIASGLAAVLLGQPLEEDVREVGARTDEPEAKLVLVHELRERP
jgi:malonyl CoA-acyl carrier protein transacylase